MDEIENLKNELKKAQETVAKIEENIKELENNSYKRWRQDKDEAYYYIYDSGYIYADTEYGFETDDCHYETGNYFKTEEEAQKVLEKLKIYTKLNDLALRLNKGRKIDWKNECQSKYHIFKKNCSLFQDINSSNQHLGTIHCLDKNFLTIAEKEIGKDNLLKLFE